ncbi:DUF6415 family natural product biosynthesis protein [Streptomyces sp. NPDC060031]|uniref:DUF6415 family natural product biosynthesis protein n=1 Tax=Streptomyces sp. NPDC060031 TaxID=3347043 RepID=UPI0036B2007D
MTWDVAFDASETTRMRVLEALQPIRPSVLELIFEDLEVVLGQDYVPDEDEIQDLSLRMRGHLRQLLAVVPEYESRLDEIAPLVATARRLLDAEVPGDLGIRAHLRRMALAGIGLLDRFAPVPAPSP